MYQIKATRRFRMFQLPLSLRSILLLLVFIFSAPLVAEEDVSEAELEQAKAQLKVEIEEAEQAEDDALIAEKEAEDAQKELQAALVETNRLVKAASEREQKSIEIQENYQVLRDKSEALKNQAERRQVEAEQKIEQLDGNQAKQESDMKKMESEMDLYSRKAGKYKTKLRELKLQEEKLSNRNSQLKFKRNALKEEWESVKDEVRAKKVKLSEIKLLVKEQLALDAAESDSINSKLGKSRDRIKGYEVKTTELKEKITLKEKALAKAQLQLKNTDVQEQKSQRVQKLLISKSQAKLQHLASQLASAKDKLGKKEKKLNALEQSEGKLNRNIKEKTDDLKEQEDKNKHLESKIVLIQERLKTLHLLNTKRTKEQSALAQKHAKLKAETGKLRKNLRQSKVGRQPSMDKAMTQKQSLKTATGQVEKEQPEVLNAMADSASKAKTQSLKKKRTKLKLQRSCEIKATASESSKTLFKKRKGKRIAVTSFNQDWFSVRLKRTKKTAYVPKSCFASSGKRSQGLKGKRFASSRSKR